MPSINFTNTPRGPLLTMYVGISIPRQAAMQAAGVPVPTMVSGTFLLDTGASSTCVDPSLMSKLGIAPTGVVGIQTPSTAGGSHQCNQYDAAIYIPGGNNIGFWVEALPIVETSLASQGIEGLIGRDIINRCTLVYNGSANLVTLAY